MNRGRGGVARQRESHTREAQRGSPQRDAGRKLCVCVCVFVWEGRRSHRTTSENGRAYFCHLPFIESRISGVPPRRSLSHHEAPTVRASAASLFSLSSTLLRRTRHAPPFIILRVHPIQPTRAHDRHNRSLTVSHPLLPPHFAVVSHYTSPHAAFMQVADDCRLDGEGWAGPKMALVASLLLCQRRVARRPEDAEGDCGCAGRRSGRRECVHCLSWSPTRACYFYALGKVHELPR